MRSTLVFGMNFAEIFMIFFIIALIFGVGRLPQLGEAIGKMRLNYGKARKGEIDITPKGTQTGGTIEDAEIVD